MNDDMSPVSDAHLRAFLLRLLHQVAADKKELPNFAGGIWLTYRRRGKLRPFSLSASLDPGLIGGQTFPEVLAQLAVVMTSEHGQVLCHSLLEPGATGTVAIGQTMFYDPDSRSLFTPKPVLVGVLVQLDGRELVLALEPERGIVDTPDPEMPLDVVINSTWAIAEAIDNMMNAPVPSNAGELAQQVLDRQPSLALASGHQVTASGSHVPGTLTSALAKEFVKRATAAAAAETQRLHPRKKGHQLRVDEDVTEVVSLYTRPRMDTQRVVTRTFRTVD